MKQPSCFQLGLLCLLVCGYVASQELTCDEALQQWNQNVYPYSEEMSKYSSKRLDSNDLGNYHNCLMLADTAHYCSCGFTLVDTSDNATSTSLLGMCLPIACNSSEVITRFWEISLILKIETDNYVLILPRSHCPDETASLSSDNIAIAVVSFLGFLLALVVVSTLCEIGINGSRRRLAFGMDDPLLYREHVQQSIEKPKAESNLVRFATSFSLIRNIKSTALSVDREDAFPVLNGIRVLSLTWVIMGHTLVFQEIYLSDLAWLEWTTSNFFWQFVTSAFFAVDTFFFLSGFLAAYHLIKEMKSKGHILSPAQWIIMYVHRYIRLTPALFVMVLISWYILPYMGEGPLWYVQDPSTNNCADYWWTNLLYIENIYPWGLGDECAGWLWYLANDMQFFVVMPLFVVAFYFNEWFGWLTVVVATFTSVIATIWLMIANDYSVYFWASNSGYWDDVYVKPWCRIQPYMVGIGLGFLCYKFDPAKIKLPPWLMYVLYGSSVIFLGIPAFGCFKLYHQQSEDAWSTTMNGVYGGICRLFWGLGLATMVYVCTAIANEKEPAENGFVYYSSLVGKYISAFLSHAFWAPVGKLTYCAYLMHPVWLTFANALLGEFVQISNSLFACFFLGNVSISLALATALLLLVEKPFANLEAILMGMLKSRGEKPKKPAPKHFYDSPEMSIE